jgi:hypothetical protein
LRNFFKDGEVRREDVNAFLRRFLPYYFFGIWVAIVIGAWHQVGFREGYNIGEWLINYEGGFVRRGFVGECLYLLAHLTGVTPLIYLVALQGVIFAVYFYFSWRMLKEKADLVKYAFLIFSPFLFTFAINSQAGGYRKEIIYFAVLSYVTYAYSSFDRKKFERFFLVVMLLYPLVILTDELGLVVVPFLIGLYWEKTRPNFSSFNKMFLLNLLLLLFNFMIFAGVVFYHQASSSQIAAIVKSLQSEGVPSLKGGGINALAWSTKENINGTFHSIVYGHYFVYYPIMIFLCLLSFIPLWSDLKNIFKSRAIFAGLLLSAFVLLPVYIIANDWGRWTYIFIVEIFMAILAKDEVVHFHTQVLASSRKWRKMRITSFSFLVFFLMSYAFFWYLPHMLPDDSSWRSFVHNVPFVRE